MSCILGACLAATTAFGATTVAAHADDATPTPAATVQVDKPILLKGSTKASYFWDDASGRMGDTGLPAIGKPMQKGLFASPSWPLGTEGYVFYKGKKAPFFIGDRGPGIPSNNGVMLDIDGKTFAELTGGAFSDTTLTVKGFDAGHINVEYVITKWGDGVGKKNYPVPFSTGAWGVRDAKPASPPPTPVTLAGEGN
ncbi:hypothetical protein Ssi03_35070 [Sphaerisporangium siamense]|uniref:Uncharacterized protein n=1 Tax=Sphaerisporangium siamense TaxID=795645 RepID=A0A7W7G861_9ACTN|nr:hypothetical protein [Sphaerisporangium siamense]MBB4701393.1 hypothetical protein [Sphaerisporangium siamense]GII85517.1 hypothetical protein Ssi03_35070 [Sphaerisporangium siamense]